MADYITLEELKSFKGIDDEDTQDDEFLALAITAASGIIDKHCHRQFGLTPEPTEEVPEPEPAPIPAQVKEATLLQANRIFNRKDSWNGIAGSPDQGSELRLLSRVDPDVQVLLSGLRHLKMEF